MSNQPMFNPDFHLQPEPELDDRDDFADAQIEDFVERVELRSAQSFTASLDESKAGRRRSRPAKSSRRQTKNSDGTRSEPKRRRPRTVLTIAIVLLAAAGLAVALLVNRAIEPLVSVEIKLLAPPPASARPVVQLPPPPVVPPSPRPVKLPPRPVPPILPPRAPYSSPYSSPYTSPYTSPRPVAASPDTTDALPLPPSP